MVDKSLAEPKKNKWGDIQMPLSEDMCDFDEDDYPPTCPYCNKEMEHVRPGKWQPTCNCYDEQG